MGYPRTNRLFDSSFCGIEMRQIWGDIPIWETLFNEHRIGAVVELGTGAGGFSLFLKMQAIARDQRFYTLDRSRPEMLNSDLGQWLHLEDSFLHGDYRKDSGMLLTILHGETHRPLLLFVDGGSKKWEVARFVPELKQGDYVAVHDYGTEFQPEDVEPVAHLLEPVLEDECTTWPKPCLTRFWRVV